MADDSDKGSDKIMVSGVPLVVMRERRARRVRLRVDARRGEAVLVLPPRASLREGRAFAQSQVAWLRARLDELPPRKEFAPGSEIALGGVNHVLRWDRGGPARVRVEGGVIRVGGDREGFAKRLTEWLKRRARERVTRKAEALAERIERKVRRVSIRDPRARWGSCTHKGDLSFSWRLVLAPPEILDYVVAHEVAHLAHLHHRPAFWRAVEKLMPDYLAARQWLDRHGPELQRYG
jgi:predicted metal-dependent hydrolase